MSTYGNTYEYTSTYKELSIRRRYSVLCTVPIRIICGTQAQAVQAHIRGVKFTKQYSRRKCRFRLDSFQSFPSRCTSLRHDLIRVFCRSSKMKNNKKEEEKKKEKKKKKGRDDRTKSCAVCRELKNHFLPAEFTLPYRYEYNIIPYIGIFLQYIFVYIYNLCARTKNADIKLKFVELFFPLYFPKSGGGEGRRRGMPSFHE